MNKIIKRWILILAMLLSGAAQAVNDFSTDPNCVALYRVENGALTVDSVGGNTLTLSVSPPTADTADYKEGAASLDCELDNTQYMYCADAGLDAGFPFKNGDTIRTMSVAFWFRPESDPGEGGINGLMGKGTMGEWFTYSWRILRATEAGGHHYWWASIGANVSDVYCDAVGTGLGSDAYPTDEWYHIVFTIDGPTLNYRLDAWRPSTQERDFSTGTFAAATRAGTTNLTIGAQQNAGGAGSAYSDGNFDEIVFFDDVVTPDEMTKIRGGTYGSSSSINNWWWRRRH